MFFIKRRQYHISTHGFSSAASAVYKRHILDRDDRVVRDEVGEVVGQLRGRPRLALDLYLILI